jgi:hypothetical protein
MVREAIESFLPRHELERLKAIQEEENATLLRLIEAM